MLVASELKGELARIHPARACCRRAELQGLLYADPGGRGVRTLDHATARIAMQLAASLGLGDATPQTRPASGTGRESGSPGRHHLQVPIDRARAGGWRWRDAPTHDRRAFLRGVLLGGASVSVGAHGPHVEFVLRDRGSANELLELLAVNEVRGGLMQRRGRQIVYLKGQDQIAALLRVVGANRALLDFETGRVGRDVRNRLNRLVNAEEANLGRTVRAADRQLQAISRLEASGELDRLGQGLREAAALRRLHPDADLDALASGLGISRSATNHRLRRLVELAAEAGSPSAERARS
jgi:cell division protein WhiA